VQEAIEARGADCCGKRDEQASECARDAEQATPEKCGCQSAEPNGGYLRVAYRHTEDRSNALLPRIHSFGVQSAVA
jgi:hypothetical protein